MYFQHYMFFSLKLYPKVFIVLLLLHFNFLFCFSLSHDFYARADLVLGSYDLSIEFYHREAFTTSFPSTSSNSGDSKNFETSLDESLYSSAVVISRAPKIGEWQLKPYSEDLYYFPLHKTAHYDDLEETLEDYLEVLRNSGGFKEVLAPFPPSQSPSTTLERVCQNLLQAQTVIITFGAGISQGWVKTLEEFYKDLGIEKKYSTDMPETKSFKKFVKRFLDDPEPILSTIRQTWGKNIVRCSVPYTPAHLALKGIIKYLQKVGKNVHVYSDNVDGIERRAGITLHEELVDSFPMHLLPSKESFRHKKIIVLCIGQSYDFHDIIASINTRAQQAKASISHININTSNETFLIKRGYDMGGLSSPDFQWLPLKMKCLQGSAQESLPALYKMIKKMES